MNSCLYETASFPGNQIVNEDEQLLPEQLITQWLLAAVHNFSARAPCYRNIAQNIWVLFYSNPPGGQVIFQFRLSLSTP